MKKELMDVLELHLSVHEFSKNVYQDQLPTEYGGKAGTFKELQGIRISVSYKLSENS